MRTNVENIRGGQAGDVLDSGGAHSRLDGSGGSDFLFGGPGPDTLIGGSGIDNLNAGGGNDAVDSRDGQLDTVDCGDRFDTDSLLRDGAERDTRGPDRIGVPVEPRVSLVTLGVSNYGRAKAFYEAMGWSPALDIEETAFFQANGCILVLWARDKLAEDTGISDDGARWSGITLAHNVSSREEVDEVIEQARANGAQIAREPSETFYGGYAGVFLDLDGHPWEVAQNPGFGFDGDGNIVLPSP